MRYSDILHTAIKAITIHKLRSGLTILGIVIAVGSIVLMSSLGEGAQRLVLNEIAGLGGETVVIRPGKEPTGPTDLGETLFADSLKQRDVDALLRKENVPELESLMPVLLVPGTVQFEGETFRPTILGGSAEFFADAFQLSTSEGVLFSEDDIKQRARVIVIGTKVANELFGANSPLGKNVRIKDQKFRVVGVFEDKGQVAFFNVNELAIVPYTTAQTYLLGINYYHEIITKASGPEAVDRTVRDIELTLRETHGITNPENDDFFVVTQQGLVNQIETILGALTLLLSLVVAIALVVGGVGVMNVMLVSVTERTKEIGLRKSLGATNKDIQNQFLLESVFLTGLGGLIGIVIGLFLSFVISFVITYYGGFNWQFSFSVPAMLLAFGVSALVGLVFGLYPARQASQKSPIEALRYE